MKKKVRPKSAKSRVNQYDVNKAIIEELERMSVTITELRIRVALMQKQIDCIGAALTVIPNGRLLRK